jgi:GNAT superfamily N-acetyltransferase
MPVPVRPARPDEATALASAYEWLFAPPGSESPGWDAEVAAARLRDVMGAGGSEVLVCEHEGELIGMCTVYRDIRSVRFGDRAWVEDLAVHPGHRSLGVGKALLDAAKDWARANGATHLELDSGLARADAHRFYERERPSWTSMSFGWQL